MGKPTGFMEFGRELPTKRDVKERIKDYKEVEAPFSTQQSQNQAARCMDCGIPFCHNGCPLGNIIPEFNDAVYEQNWEYAYQILASTNNFPEFTGRICPAPCESSCVLGINKPPVAIEFIEKSIIEKAFEMGYVKPRKPAKRTGKSVAVVGSGPAGMAAAAQLNYAGHLVTLFERADQIGGLLRYGIPDFKLEKWVVERRVQVMEEEGVRFKTGVNIGKDLTADDLLDEFDAVVLTMGSTVPRNLNIEGRQLKGVHYAMEFLSQQNKRVSSIQTLIDHRAEAYVNGDIFATDKNVVVIGGGDTGSDCVGTSNRHGAKSVTQIELMPMPPKERDQSTPWPNWPMMLRTSTSHEEGCERDWAINTKAFIGDEEGNLKALKVVRLDWQKDETGRMHMKEVPGSETEIPCELALLAAGFTEPHSNGILEQFGLELEQRGPIKGIKTIDYQSTVNPKVFAAGDVRRGQSLVVWAISEGREAARKVDEFLMGESLLEAKEVGMFNPAFAHA